ncbi:MAG: HlyC/CorC family transporter [Rhodobacteraceae bacterium]|nr:HlyC/CorC family transporter [Paracoccaceae bacterium]
MDDAGTLFDTAFWVTSGAILFLLMCSGFFSGSETALTAASRGKLRSMADNGNASAERALKIKEDQERFIGAILMGNNIANVIATSLATAVLTKIFGANGVALASLVMTLMILIFAEVLPKTFAILDAERAACLAAPVVAVTIRVLSPLVAGVRFIVRSTLRLFGMRVEPGEDVLSVRDEIVGTLTLGHSEGIVEKEDRDRLLGALDLGDRTVEEIMRHRSDIEVIDADSTPDKVLAQAIASPHTRLPVFRDDPENIIGVIHAKDLLRGVQEYLNGSGSDARKVEEFAFLTVARKPYFVPETTTLDEQMRQFLRRHTHFALVVDEYGDLQGLITLEDILEEIVGEITDEFDSGGHDGIERNADGSYTVDGGVTIRDLNRAQDWQLPDEEANTVAGLVIHEAQMIPVVGQKFTFHGFRFEVTERENNRIKTLRILPARAGESSRTVTIG